ncbi:hypothetical protein [Roseibium aggregatum]|uniref:Uncharacterized protein n=1 Tax=Roseibium aggregatum TaxID=187304 RepID=A0A939J6N8_9HYPH|nr:hypothetical protein [Roseibium aggregatum]MBN9673485.1 hypothetical protein [Roseibium aggregatum]
MTTASGQGGQIQTPHLTTTEVVRAGLSGAAITGTWTGINEAIRFRNKETTGDEALRATANSAAIGAAAGAVAQIASHFARSVPLFGLAVVAAGVGAYYIANSSKNAAQADTPTASDEGQ